MSSLITDVPAQTPQGMGPPWMTWFKNVFLACRSVTDFDTTANRPTGEQRNPLWKGRRYFDTTLGRPIWYDGTTWIDFYQVPPQAMPGTPDRTCVGRMNRVTAGFTLNNNVYQAGDIFSVLVTQNASVTATAGAGVTLYLGGGAGTSGNRTCSGRGIVTFYWNSASECYAVGNVT